MIYMPYLYNIYLPFLIKKGRDKASKGFRLHVPLFSKLIQFVSKHQPLVPTKVVKKNTMTGETQKYNFNTDMAILHNHNGETICPESRPYWFGTIPSKIRYTTKFTPSFIISLTSKSPNKKNTDL